MTKTLDHDLSEIEQRARSTGLAIERRDSAEFGPSARLRFDETEHRWPPWFNVSRAELAEALLATSFEYFRLIPRYDALLDLRDGSIEARITGRMRLLTDEPQDGGVHLGHRMSATGAQGEISIALDRASDLLVLVGESRLRMGMSRRDGARPPVLRFDGFGVEDAHGARDLLEGIGASVLFELDLTHGLGARFAPARGRPARRPVDRPQISPHLPEFPRNKYEPEPLQLYMYAREARTMPLLEFLAYYQAIEFFFPRYSEAALRRRVERLVKHPGFSAHNDRDIGALVEILREARGQGFGSELEQLKATLRECIESSELRDFIAADEEERAQFFRNRRSPLTTATVPLQDGATDIRDRVASRVYDLRCKIVHAKDPGHERVDLLLPNSPEAQLINHDIALVRLLAERVITASASPLSL